MDRAALRPDRAHAASARPAARGLRYVRRTPALAVPLLMMAAVGCLTYEFQVSLPVMASRGCTSAPRGFGFMTAAMGVGAVVGGLLVAARGKTGLRPLVLAAARSRWRWRLAALAPSLGLELVGARRSPAARASRSCRPATRRCSSPPSRRCAAA